MYGYHAQSKRSRQEVTYNPASASPPRFVERLEAQHAREGDQVRLTVRVQGKPTPSVTWYREGSKIISSADFQVQQDGDKHTLLIPEVFFEDAGNFTAKAENEAGEDTTSANLQVEAPAVSEEEIFEDAPAEPVHAAPPPPPPAPAPPAPPQFQKQLNNINVSEGHRVVLECRVQAYPEPQRIQWFRNEVEIHNSPDYEISFNAGLCTLIISECFPEDSGKFTCTITVEGVCNSTTMFLKVDVAPAPVAPPPPAPPAPPRQPETVPMFPVPLVNQPIKFGGTAHFECRAQAHPPPEILWTRKGHPLVDKHRYKSTYDQYTGTTTLTILNLCAEDEGEYTCTAINSQGEVSTSALLLGPDRYNAWLAEQRGEPAPKKALVSELEQRIESPLRAPHDFYRPMSERLLDMNTETRLSDTEGKYPDEGFIVSSFEQRLVAEIEYRDGKVAPQHHDANDKEAFDSSVPTGQAAAPVFDQKLNNFQLMEGSDATFVCKVSGNPRPFVQWYHNGRLIRPSQRYEMKMTKDGYVTLRIRVAFPEDQGHYTCCATNIVGRDTCSAELFVDGLGIDETSYVTPDTLRRIQKSPALKRDEGEGGVSERHFRPVFRKVPADMEVNEGKMCRFDCVVSGRPMPEIFWYRDDQQVHSDNLHKIVINEDGIHSLIIHATYPHDAGQYTCVARNKGGEDRFQVHLNVLPLDTATQPMFTERLSNQAVREGQPVTLIAYVQGVPPPMLSWQRDNKHINPDDQHYKIENSPGQSTLYIPCPDARDNAWFQCTAASKGGTATTRARLTVQAEARKPEPERKLVITKRTTPTPTQGASAGPKRPSLEPSQTAKANLVLTPSPQIQPEQVQPAFTQPPPRQRRPVDEPDFIQPEQAQAAFSAPPPSRPQPMQPDSGLINLIKQEDQSKPDRQPRQRQSAPQSRPPTIELIKQGVEPAPAEEDMYNKGSGQPPKFKVPIRSQTNLVESQRCIFETRLVPIGDPDMLVEWYKDGKLLRAGHRFVTVNDFGYVCLELLWTYPEDNGTYMVVATNKFGQDQTQADIHCFGKESVIYESQLPEDSKSVQDCYALEENIRRTNMPRERLDDDLEPSAPVFDLMPEAVQAEEGDTAKFMCKVSGHPRPRVTWWVNGAIIVSGHRFVLRYDGMIYILEIPKVREYDNGTVRVVAKNPLGEAECSTTLVVIPREDWRSRLKQAPRSTVEVELAQKVNIVERSTELNTALRKPKTTVVEIRAFERSAQEKFSQYKDEEVRQAYQAINTRHAEMNITEASHELRMHEPNVHIESEVHRERARYMLGLMSGPMERQEPPRIPRSQKTSEPPTFTKPLMNVNAKEGQAVKMEVNFKGFPTPECQWFREGIEIQPSRDFQITSLNSKSFLLIPEVFLEDAGTYTIRATNQFGLMECKATLKVKEDTTKIRDVAPEFRVQMHDLSMNIGEPATFDVQVSGTPRPEVYWTKDGRRIPQSPRWKFIVESNHFTLLIFEVRTEDQGLYECVLVNKIGKATCSARLTAEGVQPVTTQQTFAAPPQGFVAPQLVTPMKDCLGSEGDSATFQCVISGNPEPVIQWYYENQVIKPSKYFLMHSQGGVHTLQIAGAFPEDEGAYKCVARNQGGEVTCIAHLKVLGKTLSSEAELDLTKGVEAPRFGQPLQAVDVKDGQSARFEAVVSGSPPPQVTWFREGIQIPNSQDFQIIQEGNRSILFIREVLPEDAGVFTCRLTNAAGVAECSAELFVEDTKRAQAQVQLKQQQPKGPSKNKPQILKAPSPTREVIAGNTTRLVVQIQADPPPRFTWYVNGMQIKPSQRHKVSYDNGIITLIIFNVQVSDSGEYMLKATNELGDTTCKTTLNIMPSQKVVQLPAQTREVQITTTTSKTSHISKTEIAPVFIQPLQPEIRATANSVARLECQLQAYPAPAVTWHVNGIEVKPSPKYTINREAEKSILLIKNAQPQDSGVYSCRAVSELGEAVCSTTLFITAPEPAGQPPKFTQTLQNQVADDGKEIIFNCQVTGVPSPDIFWFHNDKSIDKSEDFVINYERKTGKIELVIVDCLPDDSGVFKCIARNNAGEDITCAQLTVTPAPKPIVEEQMVMPEVAQEAQSKVRKEVQQTAVIEVVRKESVESISSNTSSTKDVRVIKKVVKRTSGQPPRFTKPIQPQVVREGDIAVFTAIVSGAPVPEIVWLKDKVEMKPSEHFSMEFEPNTGLCSLKIFNSQAPDVGVYSCRAQNAAGRATCTANVVVVPQDAEVTVTEKTVSVKKEKVTVVGEEETRVVENSPTFTQPLMPQTEANEGDVVQLTCQVECEPSPKVAWYHNSKEILSTSRIQITFDVTTRVTTLTIHGVFKADEGDYICRAANPLGEGTTRTVLHIKGKEPVRAAAPVPTMPEPVGEAPIMPEDFTPAHASVPMSQPAAEVPPAPMTEPCAVISKEPEAPRFTLPLRDQQINDGDKALFKVFFRGNPNPTVTWFFNSQPIKPSRDFQINVDVRHGESTLIIVEVFPEDEGEYMCKAENTMGAAVTHCHLFVRLPSSSSGVSDEEGEKLTSRTTETFTTIEPISIKEQRRFSETIAIDHKQKFKQMELQFGKPEPKISKAEMKFQQPATPRGIKMEVEVPHISSEKVIELKQRAEALLTQRQTLNLPIYQQRRFSETIAIDHTRLQPVELQFQIPPKQPTVSKSSLTVQKSAQPKGVKMEVDIHSFRRELSTVEVQRQKQVLAMEIQRQEFQMQLMGKPPRFVWQLNSLKVMDGEEARFVCKVTGNPMPDVAWYHNGKLVVDNPDFKTAYDKNTGECILHILEVFPQDTGKYECVATNKYGKAVTKATLLVEVFEYVPDSEEATASQTESVVSTSSIDEVEFERKTQKFLENMETLRREIQEDITETDYTEEIIEELEIEEQGYEETIQMADVKWQFQKKAVATEMRPSPERSIEVIPAFRPEQPKEEEIQIDISTAVTHRKRLSQVRPIQQQVSEEATQEIYATGADTMQHEEIEVELARHRVEPTTETRVQPQMEEMLIDTHEELAPEVTEDTQQEEIAQVQFTRPVAPKKPETRVEAMTEEVPIETPQDIVAEGALESEQQEIPQVEMMEPLAPQKTETMVQAVTEEVPVEAHEDIIAEGALETEQKEIAKVELSEPIAPQKLETRVQAMVEDVQMEVHEELIAEGALETEQKEIQQVEMTQAVAPVKTETHVLPQTEQLLEETIEETRSVSPDLIQEEVVSMDVVDAAQAAISDFRAEAQVEKLTEETAVDITEEYSTETTQHEEITVEMATHAVHAAAGAMVFPQEEVVDVEDTQEMTETIPDAELTEGQDVIYDIVNPSVKPKTETRVESVLDILSEGNIEEELAELIAEQMAEEETKVSLESSVQAGKPTINVDIVEERQSEEEDDEFFYEAPEPAVEGVDVPTEVAVLEQTTKTEMLTLTQEAHQQVELTEESMVEFTTEVPQQEEIVVSLDAADKKEALPAMVQPQLQITEPLQTDELNVVEVSEDRTEESQVTVSLTTAEKELAKPSMVGGTEELIEVQETRPDVVEITEEFTMPEEVHVDLAVQSQDEKPTTLVRQIIEGQAPEQVEQELEGNIKEVYLIPGFVAPSYEPSVVEKFRFEAHVQTRHAEHQVEQATEHRVETEVTTVEKKTQVVEHLAAKMALSIVRAVQEVTEEQEHVTEVITEEVEVIKKAVEEAIQPEDVASVQAAPKKLTAKQLMAPVFEIPLSDVTIGDGERATLEARVTGVPQPVVTWYVDAQEIKPSADFRLTYEDGICMLDITDALPEDEGEYTIKAVNEAGTCVTTAYLTVLAPSESDTDLSAVEEPMITAEKTTVVKASGEKVIEERKKLEIDVSVTTKKETHRSTVEISMPSSPQAPVFVSKLQPKEIFESMPVTLECQVSSNPVPTITWFKDNKKLTSTKHIQLDYKQGICSMSIDKVTLKDEAEYKCEARNELGVTTTMTELLVEKLIGAVEQVIFEEYYEVDIEMYFKWRQDLKAALPATQDDKEIIQA